MEIEALNVYANNLTGFTWFSRSYISLSCFNSLDQVYLEKNGGVFTVISSITQLSCGGKSVCEQGYICHFSCILFFFYALETTFQRLTFSKGNTYFPFIGLLCLILTYTKR